MTWKIYIQYSIHSTILFFFDIHRTLTYGRRATGLTSHAFFCSITVSALSSIRSSDSSHWRRFWMQCKSFGFYMDSDLRFHPSIHTSAHLNNGKWCHRTITTLQEIIPRIPIFQFNICSNIALQTLRIRLQNSQTFFPSTFLRRLPFVRSFSSLLWFLLFPGCSDCMRISVYRNSGDSNKFLVRWRTRRTCSKPAKCDRSTNSPPHYNVAWSWAHNCCHCHF